jgi:hypothetical protein
VNRFLSTILELTSKSNVTSPIITDTHGEGMVREVGR